MATRIESELTEISALAGNATKEWQDLSAILLGVLSQNNLNSALQQTIPGCKLDYRELDKEIVSILTITQGISPKETLIPNQYIADAKDCLFRVREKIKDLSDFLDKNLKNISGIDEKFHLINHEGNRFRDLNSELSEIRVIADNLLHSSYNILSTLRSRGVPPLTGLVRSIRQANETAAEARSQAEESAKKAEAGSQKVAMIEAQFEDVSSLIESFRAEAESAKDRISGYENEVGPKANTIREITSKAAELKETVEAYRAEFESFQSQLDRRNKALENGNDGLKKLIANLENQRTEIERISNAAEQMLSGATTSGLAAEFYKISQDLEKSRKFAIVQFYVSIALLVASTVPLILYIFGIDRGFLFEGKFSSPSTYQLSIEGVVSRLIVIFPFAWLARFAQARHSSLFRLKEYYSHKYSLAASVEGFKRQAPEYEGEIAAATYVELASLNPAEHMDKHSPNDGPPNPVLKWLLEKLSKKD